MSRLQKKKKASEDGRKKSDLYVRQDLPDKDSIIGEKEFISPKGKKYRIIITDELDPYEEEEK